MGGKIKLGLVGNAFRDGLVEGDSQEDCPPGRKIVRSFHRPVTPLPSPPQHPLIVAVMTVMPGLLMFIPDLYPETMPQLSIVPIAGA